MKRDEQFLREKREEFIQEHSEMIRLSSLRSQNPGTVLLVRVIEQPLQIGALYPVMNVVEDITHDVNHLEVFFPSTSPPTAVLKQGNVVAIKEPLYVMNHGRKVVRVVHPSNIMVLKTGHEMYPKAFQKLAPPTRTTLEWHIEGNDALGRGDYTEAIDWYRFYESRADAAIRAGLYDLALEDARILLSASEDLSKSESSKALYLAGSAAYQSRKFALAEIYFRRFLATCPTDAQCLQELHRVQERLREENTGAYDFTAMLGQQTFADHATFINKTEIQESEDHGRGLYAKDDIKCGELVFCEKAFKISHPAPTAPNDPYSVQYSNYYGGCGKGIAALWLRTVQKAFANPSFAKDLLTLYGGMSYIENVDALLVDGQLAINVYQVLQIIDHNVYSFEAGHAQEPYGTTRHSSNEERESVGLYQHASYMNHSCLNNTSRSMTGDMMIVRANKPIAKGTEITTCYLSPNIGEPRRNAELNRIWKFQCDCRLCASEIACEVDWKPIFDEVRRYRLPSDMHDTVSLEDKINEAQKLVAKYEGCYPKQLFEVTGLPRIALREVQEILMVSNSRLDNDDKTAEHALDFIRESGYQIRSEEASVSMNCQNGIPSKGLVDALYLLAKHETRREAAEQYLCLAKQMYLTINGTYNAWEVAYGEIEP
ncbi:SET domain-containing protein [Aureobasidium sp. EXF-8845]|nr:SET domain-containing protein [Aureobasidium sp. EXF-8845]KAI4857420.1 SET domain-containing protein [Aureobasidium sp. EXF-8846]